MRCRTGFLHETVRHANSCVRKRFIELSLLLAFFAFEYLAAIQTLDVFGIVVSRDQLYILVLASRIRHWGFSWPDYGTIALTREAPEMSRDCAGFRHEEIWGFGKQLVGS